MTTRRTFLKYSAGATGAISISGVNALAENQLLPDLIIADRKIPNSDKIVRRLFGNNTSILSFDRDPITIWERYLLPKIQSASPIIAGVTSGYAAFAISEIAQDYGAYLVFAQPVHPEGCNNGNCMPAISLSQAAPVVWALGPRGINFR